MLFHGHALFILLSSRTAGIRIMNKIAACNIDLQPALRLIVPLVAFLLAVPLPLAAHQNSQLMMIIDNSSSMEDQLGGELKYKLVRRAMTHTLSSYGGQIRTGLITYGANYKNSCKDISQVISLKPLQPDTFSLVINEIRPRGKSPIGAALSAAATVANAAAHPLHMLLIADGRDNCGANLCATAKNIARRLPKTRIHVIGLGQTEGVRKLACIAKATRGVFLRVDNTAGLTTALNKIVDGVSKKKRFSTHRPITQTLSFLVRPPLPKRRPPNKIAKYEEPEPDLPPDVTASFVVKEAPESSEPKSIDSEAAKPQKVAQNSVSAEKPAPLIPAPIPVPPAPQKTPEKPQNAPKAAATPSPAKPAAKFLGNQPSIEITLPKTSASVKLGALITEQGNPIQHGLIWRIYDSRKDDTGRYKLVKTVKAPHFEDTLPLGVYLVNLSWGRSHLTEKMDILSSKPFAHNFVLNAGGLRLGSKHMDGSVLPAREVVYRIYSDERDQFGKRRLILNNAKPGKTIRLNAGIYHVESLYGTANGLIESDITVEAGKLTDAIINHRASKVTFKLVNQPGGEALAGALWRISTPDGKLIKQAGGALPTLILAAGDYTINATYSGRTFARKVTIEPGDPVHVEIVIQ